MADDERARAGRGGFDAGLDGLVAGSGDFEAGLHGEEGAGRGGFGAGLHGEEGAGRGGFGAGLHGEEGAGGRHGEPRIALYGGSFDPPGRHHQAVAVHVARLVDRLVVVPCGPRPDKRTTGAVAARDRAALARIAFGGLPGVELDEFDLAHERFTRTWDLEARYADAGQVWHVVGADLVAGGGQGASQIQRQWYRGEALWQRSRFLVLTRPGVPLAPGDLPPRARQISLQVEGRSRDLRSALARGEQNLPGLAPEVEAYIRAHHLYGT